MTVEDIALFVQARQERDRELTQMLASIVYSVAALTGVAVNNPNKFPSLDEAFPGLFEKKGQQDWRVMKLRLENYAKTRKNTHVEI